MQVFKSMSRVTVTLVLLALFCRRAHGDCDDALGLESGEVSHRQITSSDPSYGRSSLYTVRLNHRYDWYLWNEKKYFKIDFLDRKKITSLGIQGAGGRVTTMLWIFHSLDGQVWETYTDRSGSQDIHLAPRSASEIIKLKLDKPIQVRYIAVSPRSYRPGIRLEVYGCNSTETDNKKPTIIERDIDGNTIWTPLNSPYIIRSIVTVKASSQLYIQPGVKIIFESEDAGLVIRGKVTASGIQSLPVCFLSHKIPYKAETQWKGVNVESSGRFECNFCEIRNGETGLSGTLNSLFLQNVKFSMNGNGLKLINGGSKGNLLQRLHFVENIENHLFVAENWITRSRLVIKDSEFDGASNGILLRGQAILELDGCNISHSGRYGVKIETKTAVSISTSLFISNNEDITLSAAVNVSVDSSSFINGDVGLFFNRGSFANITNSVFKNMAKGIMSRRRFEGGLAVSTSVFDSNDYGIYIHEIDNWRQSQVKVVNSTFQNERKGDIFIECDYMSFMLEDNIFNGSYPETYPLSISTQYGYDSYVVIKGNTIINYERQARLSAKRQSNGGVIEIKVIENVFENLTGMYALNIDAASELIANNTFRNGVHYATLNVSGINTVIHRNIFDNKDSTYEIFTEAHYMENGSIDARFNYFGSLEKDYVASRVNGVFENMSLAEIAINPFYISTLLDKLNYGAGMYSENPNAAGGELRGDLLIPDNKRLIVIRTIIIPTGVTLTVSRNVTMTFLGEIGIIVKGTLNILGTENMNVILKSGKKEGWGGIMIRNGAFLMTQGKIEGAEMVVDVPSSTCSSMLTVNVDKSEITADRISLTARNFNLSITDSKLSGHTQDFLFSTCENTNELKLDSHFVILRSDIETSKFQIITNRYDAVKLEIKVSKSNFIGVDNEMAEENRNVIFNLSSNIESEMVLSKNNFSDITVVITAEKPLAKNIIVTRNQFKTSWLKISVPTIILTYNIFDSALSYSVMYIRETFTDYVINGTYNYWGTSEYLNIIAKVYDKTNNLKLPLIKVVPFFKDKLLSDVVETADFIGSNNSLGGSIEGTVHLTKHRNPYTVYSTIYVGPGNTLRIDPGVQLLFQRNTGIIVEGNILVMGTPEAPVVFSSTNPGNPWEGVIIKGPGRNVRLTGGKDEREGKVEIRRGNTYSTVCQLGFDSRDAEVICKMAGFDPRGGVVIYEGADLERFGTENRWDEIVYHSLNCTGLESHLDDCERQELPVPEYRCDECQLCSHREDTCIRCLGVKLPTDDVKPEVHLEYIEVNDTISGIAISAPIRKASHIKSKYSQSQGINVNNVFMSRVTYLEDIDASFNMEDGILIDGMDKFREVIINKCVASHNEGHGINLVGYNTVVLTRCDLTRNKAGVYSENYVFMNLSIADCHFAENLHHAVKVFVDEYRFSELYLNLTRNNITSHNLQFFSSRSWDVEEPNLIQIDWYSSHNGTFHMEDNAFTNNTGNCVSAMIANTATLKDNTFISNSGMILKLNEESETRCTINISSNTVKSNRQIYEDQLMKIELSKTDSIFHFYDNEIVENKAETLLSVENRYDIRQSNINIINNSLTKNIVQHAIAVQLYGLRIHNNSIVNPGSICELQMPAFDSGSNDDATLNYWGVHQVRDIMNKVCSFDTDMKLGFVKYLPFLSSKNPYRVDTKMHTDFDEPGAFGGVIEDTMILNATNVIERSIMIQKDGKLVLKGGIQLKFMPNRGIYSYGSLETKPGNQRILLVNETVAAWYGMVINQTSDLFISNITISGSQNGLVLDARKIVMSKCTIRNSHASGMTLHSKVNEIDMALSDIYNSNEHGIHVYSHSIHLQNGAVFNNSGNGLYFDAATNSTSIRNITIYNNRNNGVHFQHSEIQNYMDVTILNSHIYDHKRRYAVIIVSYLYVESPVRISIGKSLFENNPEGSVFISVVSNTGEEKRYVDIYDNTFLGYGWIDIDLAGWSNITFNNNLIKDHSSSTKCCVTVQCESQSESTKPNNILNVWSNDMKNSTGKCGYSFKSDLSPEGTFRYNEISNSVFSEGSLLLEIANYTATQSIFDNPSSDYEIKLLKTGSGYLNATENWWGTTNLNVIADRIVDKNDDGSLQEVKFLPIIESRIFDCSRVNNCSGQGTCNRPNGCECFEGWTGESCDQHDCSDLSDCNQGTCIGPNQCECKNGWIGDSCTVATCFGVNNCSGNGFCAEPNICNCIRNFGGPSCNECAPNRWGPSCRPCPQCLHGTCNRETGKCVCQSTNWNGTLCDKCSKTYYGARCLPIPTVLKVSPNAGLDIGGTLVHVKGDNFNVSETGLYKCRFGSVVVNASRLSSHHFTCISPKLSPRTVPVEISFDGKTFTDNQIPFLFVARCDFSTCGSSFSPPHGQCVFGQCNCNLPWTGKTCTEEIITPTVEQVEDRILVEGQEYQEILRLIKGTHVIRWSLLEAPKGMTINMENGTLLWRRTIGHGTPYKIKARAENPAGHDDLLWQISVPPSYSVVIDELSPSGVLPYPREVLVRGHIKVTDDVDLTSATVKILIRNRGHIRELTTLVDDKAPSVFQLNFIPKPDDAGNFSISANHPSDDHFVEQASWRIVHMKCQPSVVTLTAYLENNTANFPGIAHLTNPGVDPIENISVKINSYSFGVNSATVTFRAKDSDDSDLLVLASKQNVSFDLTIKNNFPVKTDLYIVFRSGAGTRAVLHVYVELKIRSPVLQMSQTSISKTVIKGKQTIINIDITNVGESAANDLNVEIPDGVNIEVVSLSTSSDDSLSTSFDASSEKVDLPEGGTATLVLMFTAPTSEVLTLLSGKIIIGANNVLSVLPFTFYVTDDEQHDLQVEVEDEYTYFAAGKPLLQDAKVTLENQRRGVKKSLVTDEKGAVKFQAVYSDRYMLKVEADNHTSESIIIVVDGSKSTYSVFLQRSAVTYSWTVTKTMFEDKYEIHLETHFETRVPMPVVDIQPAKVNIFPYLEGRKTHLEFLVTNHGYIRANKVRFDLPNHPQLTFTQLVDNIGDLEANSSMVIPLRVQRKTISKRSLTSCILGLKYSFECGTEITKETKVVLTNEPPDEPPSSCGFGGWNWWLIAGPVNRVGGGGLSSSTAVHMSATQLCECVKAYVDGCLISALRLPLELKPGINCLVDIHDLIQLDASSSDVAIATTLAATAIDCKLGYSCPPCVYIFKALNCLDGLVRACRPKGNGKGKPEPENPDLTDEILKAKEHLDNYIDATDELFGDRGVVDVDGDWKTKFSENIDVQSADDYLLTADEVNNILSSVSASDHAVIYLFLIRWNNTFSAWQNGTTLAENANSINLQRFRKLSHRFLDDTRYVKKRGFATIFAHFDHTINVYKESKKEKEKKEQGVCGRVSIHISQNLVLTRDAFTARLELENGENEPLEEIKVEINITKTTGNGSSDNHLFSIGEPKLNEISGVTGSGVISSKVKGSAEWLIVPKGTAARTEDVYYDVGGTLSYLHNGVQVTVPLLPDMITVSPNPSLTLSYFHEKFVQGDDPLTAAKEKVVPFCLAVMVTNKGDGIARHVEITSGQPEIVDNDKGLLVSFKIKSAQLGINPITPSLTINFGDISVHETKTARWFLTSTLKGKFNNYSATFENINPLGDPELSVFSSISYHETIHLVRINGINDDMIDDFLVNDVRDKENLPDKLYDSSDGFTSYPVNNVPATTFALRADEFRESKRYSVVKIVVPNDGKGWRYTRIINNLTTNTESESLLQVTRDDGKEIMVPQNSWLTSHYDNKFYFHLLDRRDSQRKDSTYIAFFGLKNMHQPSFDNESYYIEIEGKRSIQNILKVHASDIEGDSVSYCMTENETFFTVNKFTGMIRSKVPLLENGSFEMPIFAIDDGIPERTGTVSVTVVVTASVTTTPNVTVTTEKSAALGKAGVTSIQTFIVIVIAYAMT